MLHIIVPTCIASEGIYADFMRSLEPHVSVDCRLYMIVNDERVASRMYVVSAFCDMVVYLEQHRIGYVNACNIGYRLADPADDDLVVVLNDDLVFEGDWLNPLVAAIRGGAAQAGPGLKWVGRDGKWGNGDEKYQYLEGWCFMTTGLAIREAHHRRGRNECWENRDDGVMTCLARRPFGTTQLFDPAFAPAFCEDMDLSIRIQVSGGTLKQVDLPIRHLRSMTYGNERPSWAKNRELLISKWDLG